MPVQSPHTITSRDCIIPVSKVTDQTSITLIVAVAVPFAETQRHLFVRVPSIEEKVILWNITTVAHCRFTLPFATRYGLKGATFITYKITLTVAISRTTSLTFTQWGTIWVFNSLKRQESCCCSSGCGSSCCRHGSSRR